MLLRPLFLLPVLLALPMAMDAQAQRPLSLTRAEVLASGAPDLHAAVQQLRPDWLAIGGAPDDPAATERVIVILDGRHIGDLRVLRSLSSLNVAALRLQSGEVVRGRYPRVPRTEFVAAILVSSHTPVDAAARTARRSLRLYAVLPARGQQATLEGAMAEHGFSRLAFDDIEGIPGAAEPGWTLVPGIGVGAATRVRGALGVELVAEHVFPTFFGRAGRQGEVLSAEFSWSDAMALASLQQWPVRVAAGPVVRRTAWTWSGGYCRCDSPESTTSYGYGVAAGFSASLAPRGRTALELQAGLRHFLSHDLPEHDAGFRHRPALDLSGTEFHLAFGVAAFR